MKKTFFRIVSFLKRALSQASGSLFLLFYLTIAPSLLGSILAGYALVHQHWLSSLSLFAIAILNFAFSIALALGWMPTTVFSLLSGYLWGWGSVPFLLFSYVLASLLGYFLTSKLDNGRLSRALEEKFPLQKTITQLEKSSFWLTVFCRLSPVLPFSVMNAIFAMVRYPLVTFIGGSIVGMLPRTVFAVFLGDRFSHITSMQQLKTDYGTWSALLLVVLSFIGIGWIGKKRLK